MSLDRVFNIAGLLIGATIVTILVSHSETKNVINALGSSFSGTLRAAQGK